jgi:hypothetical protein
VVSVGGGHAGSELLVAMGGVCSMAASCRSLHPDRHTSGFQTHIDCVSSPRGEECFWGVLFIHVGYAGVSCVLYVQPRAGVGDLRLSPPAPPSFEYS